MKNGSMPMLFPIAPEQYWGNIQQIIMEELNKIEKEKQTAVSLLETPGLTYKPLLKIAELCALCNKTDNLWMDKNWENQTG